MLEHEPYSTHQLADKQSAQHPRQPDSPFTTEREYAPRHTWRCMLPHLSTTSWFLATCSVNIPVTDGGRIVHYFQLRGVYYKILDTLLVTYVLDILYVTRYFSGGFKNKN